MCNASAFPGKRIAGHRSEVGKKLHFILKCVYEMQVKTIKFAEQRKYEVL